MRAFVAEAQAAIAGASSPQDACAAIEPRFAELLAASGWLPVEYQAAAPESGMGGGIGQWLLYRAGDGSLSLFSLVVPPSSETPIHDHLAWGLVGLYRGRQDETVYRRLDDGLDPAHATLEIAKQQTLARGEFYALLPPTDDIHYVKTISDTASISIHLLANDTACVWRHRFEPDSGKVTPFRSGYANAPCPPEGARQ